MNKKTILIVVAIFIVIIVAIVAAPWNSGGSQNTLNQGTVQENNQIIAPPAGNTQNTVSGSASKPAAGQSQPQIAKDGAYIINYENSGFNPENLIVSVGKMVRFINNSGKAMRVYSKLQDNLHSSFNQSVTVGKGGVYNFLFTDKGLWEYYNLNAPADAGSIVVY